MIDMSAVRIVVVFPSSGYGLPAVYPEICASNPGKDDLSVQLVNEAYARDLVKEFSESNPDDSYKIYRLVEVT